MSSKDNLLENQQLGKRGSSDLIQELFGIPFFKRKTSAKKCTYNVPNQFVDLLFKCPQLDSNKVMTRSDWRTQIRLITEQIKEKNPLQAAIIEIKSFNHAYRVEKCIETLEQYLKQLIDNPGFDEHRYIDIENKVFKENVKATEGAVCFLTSVGFRRSMKNRKEVLVFYDYLYRRGDLRLAIHLLHKVKGFELELDRDCRVFTEPVLDGDLFLHSDFFENGPAQKGVEDRLRRYQMAKGAGIRTRNLYRLCREKGRPLYARVWVRLGHGLRVEGTFAAEEKLSEVRELVQAVVDLGEDRLTAPELCLVRNSEEKSLAELGLVPTGVLQFPLPPSKNTSD